MINLTLMDVVKAGYNITISLNREKISSHGEHPANLFVRPALAVEDALTGLMRSHTLEDIADERSALLTLWQEGKITPRISCTDLATHIARSEQFTLWREKDKKVKVTWVYVVSPRFDDEAQPIRCHNVHEALMAVGKELGVLFNTCNADPLPDWESDPFDAYCQAAFAWGYSVTFGANMINDTKYPYKCWLYNTTTGDSSQTYKGYLTQPLADAIQEVQPEPDGASKY